MAKETITIRTQACNMEAIKDRCGYAANALTLGDVISRDVERYYSLLGDARRSLLEQFSSAELMLIVDSCNGTLWTPSTVCALAFNVEDSINFDGLDEKWSVDGAALLAKIQAIDHLQNQALVDAIERFWTNPARFSGDGANVLGILA